MTIEILPMDSTTANWRIMKGTHTKRGRRVVSKRKRKGLHLVVDACSWAVKGGGWEGLS